MSTTGQRPSFSPSSPRLVRMTVVHPRRPGCPRRGIAKIPNCRVHRAYATVRARPRVLGLRELGPSDRITHSRRRLRPCSSRRVRTEFFGEVFRYLSFRRVSSIVRRFQQAVGQSLSSQLFQSVPPHAHSTTVSQSGSAASGQSSRSPPIVPPTVSNSGRLRFKAPLLPPLQRK